MSKLPPSVALRLALLRAIDPQAAAVLEAEYNRRTSADADSTAPSADYIAHRAHAEAVQEALRTGAPIPTMEEMRLHLRSRARRSDFFPEGGRPE
jgi:hypothetical protein